MNAVLISVSLFQWESAIELLLQNNQYEKAALLLSSCRSFNVPINNDILFHVYISSIILKISVSTKCFK